MQMAQKKHSQQSNLVCPSIEELLKPTEKDLSCIYEGCQKTFRHRPALNMHLTQTHKLKGYGDFTKRAKQLYLCPVTSCARSSQDRPFNNLKALRNHYISMHKEKNLSCTKCGKRLATDKQLASHTQTCGKMYACHFCEAPFANLEGLTKHQMNIHTAAYQRVKALKLHHSFYTIVNANDVQNSLSNKSAPSATSGTRNDTDSVSSKQAGKSLVSCVEGRRRSDQEENVTNRPPTTIKVVHLMPAGNPASSTSNINEHKYVPLLPKRTHLPSSDRISHVESKEMATQTDVLGVAVQASDIILEDQCTNTTGPIMVPSYTLDRSTTTMPQYASTGSYPYYSQPVTPQWPMSNSPDVRQLCCNPADFSTQTSFVEPQTSNTNFGTQTALSGLLEVVARSSSSIELQCELGDEPLPSGEQCFATLDEVASFGTQTISSFVADPSMSRTDVMQNTNAQVSSFGTQTTSDGPDNSRVLNIPESYPLQNSTSDFSMQFPYQLMDFGTQTNLLQGNGDISDTFMFDDELLGEQTTGTSVQLSQSSTQTDLDFLFNNIETQTDWQV